MLLTIVFIIKTFLPRVFLHIVITVTPMQEDLTGFVTLQFS